MEQFHFHGRKEKDENLTLTMKEGMNLKLFFSPGFSN